MIDGRAKQYPASAKAHLEASHPNDIAAKRPNQPFVVRVCTSIAYLVIGRPSLFTELWVVEL